MQSRPKVRFVKMYNKIVFDDPARVFVEEICSDVSPTSILSDPSTLVVTQGSCFALNVADRLRAMNIRTESIPVSEVVNNPFANLALADTWVRGKESPYWNVVMEAVDGGWEALSRWRDRIASAQMLIFTLGTAFVWEHAATGRKCIGLDKRRIHEFKTVYFDQKALVKLISLFVKRLREISPSIYIWFTVSPVPCEGTTVFRSAVTSDVVSKSLLRSAIFVYLQSASDRNAQYFPAFELVRGVSGHFPEAFFGSDGKNRHVKPEIVNLIVDEFIRRNQGKQQRSVA